MLSVVFPSILALALNQVNPLDNLNLQDFQFTPPGPNKVVWVQSPNFGDRPQGTVVDTIVLHHTAGKVLAGTVKWFTMPESQVSAHFVIGRDGSIVQQVSTYKRAWHAGVSIDAFGRKGVNDFSVGIEIDNVGDGTQPYPEAQVEAVEHVVSVLMRRFPIRQITSHEFIAEPQGRKNDPIDFPWQRMERFHVPLYYGLKKDQSAALLDEVGRNKTMEAIQNGFPDQKDLPADDPNIR